MRDYLCAFAMCQSMFCALPFPGSVWEEKARSKMLLFLPVVGLEIGILWAGIAWLCNWLDLPVPVKGLILAVCPWLVTGCIHLDGYMDVTDAVGSCRSPERRREILKDSHVGAFAVIGMVLLGLSQFACLMSLPETADCRVLILIPAVSRCCSALAVMGLKPMSTSQYADQKRENLAVPAIMLVLFLTAGYLLLGRSAAALVGCVAVYGLALRKAYRSLDGMNGDISGYALTLGELGAVALWALL